MNPGATGQNEKENSVPSFGKAPTSSDGPPPGDEVPVQRVEVEAYLTLLACFLSPCGSRAGLS